MTSYSKNRNADFFTVEAYKLARTNIALSIIKQGCKRVAVTSAVSHEGKTTTACNIAAAFSKHLNSHTIIIDCDLRKPTVCKFFNLKNTPGITNYLGGMCTLDEAIQCVPNTDLHVLCAGIIPPNPSELLSSAGFSALLDELSERYDYIIIDTPPINIVSDVIPVAGKVDGLVLVAYEEVSNYVEIDKALESLKRCDAKVLGFVLNGSKGKEKKSKRYKY